MKSRKTTTRHRHLRRNPTGSISPVRTHDMKYWAAAKKAILKDYKRKYPDTSKLEMRAVAKELTPDAINQWLATRASSGDKPAPEALMGKYPRIGELVRVNLTDKKIDSARVVGALGGGVYEVEYKTPSGITRRERFYSEQLQPASTRIWQAEDLDWSKIHSDSRERYLYKYFPSGRCGDLTSFDDDKRQKIVSNAEAILYDKEANVSPKTLALARKIIACDTGKYPPKKKSIKGLAEDEPDTRFPKEALEKGIKMESRGFVDKKVARQRAKARLIEDIKYYDNKEAMEKGGTLLDKLEAGMLEPEHLTEKQRHWVQQEQDRRIRESSHQRRLRKDYKEAESAGRMW